MHFVKIIGVRGNRSSLSIVMARSMFVRFQDLTKYTSCVQYLVKALVGIAHIPTVFYAHS
jgi:hypothetical protein